MLRFRTTTLPNCTNDFHEASHPSTSLAHSHFLTPSALPFWDSGATADPAQFQITSNNTALITIYSVEQYDLSSYNVTATDGSSGWIIAGYAQEINVTSGEPRLSPLRSAVCACCVLTSHRRGNLHLEVARPC
jgi:hypothetical protein